MVTLGRFELPTCGLGNRRSIHLSYGANFLSAQDYRSIAASVTVGLSALNRWARYGSVGTKDTTVPFFGVQDELALPALIEKLASILRHRLLLGEATLRTG